MKFRNTLTAVLALAAGFAEAPAAYAIDGYAQPWQIGLQPSNSPSMEGIHMLNDPDAAGVDEITLSYTFYPVDKPKAVTEAKTAAPASVAN